MNTEIKEKGNPNLVEKSLIDLIEYIEKLLGKEIVKKEILSEAYESEKPILK